MLPSYHLKCLWIPLLLSSPGIALFHHGRPKQAVASATEGPGSADDHRTYSDEDHSSLEPAVSSSLRATTTPNRSDRLEQSMEHSSRILPHSMERHLCSPEASSEPFQTSLFVTFDSEAAWEEPQDATPAMKALADTLLETYNEEGVDLCDPAYRELAAVSVNVESVVIISHVSSASASNNEGAFNGDPSASDSFATTKAIVGKEAIIKTTVRVRFDIDGTCVGCITKYGGGLVWRPQESTH